MATVKEEEFVLCWRENDWAEGIFSVSNKTWAEEAAMGILDQNRKDYPDREFFVTTKAEAKRKLKIPKPRVSEKLTRPEEVGRKLREFLALNEIEAEKKTKIKWKRFWVCYDTEADAATDGGMSAIAIAVLDSETGEIANEFGASFKPRETDEDTLNFWKKFPKIREHLQKKAMHPTSVARHLDDFFQETFEKIFHGDSWTLATDNPDFDGMMLNNFLCRMGYQPARKMIEPGEYGAVRCIHSLALGLFALHENPGKAYRKLCDLAVEVVKEQIKSDPPKYAFDGILDEEMMVHHPLFDARCHASTVMAIRRTLEVYGPNAMTWAAGFKI